VAIFGDCPATEKHWESPLRCTQQKGSFNSQWWHDGETAAADCNAPNLSASHYTLSTVKKSAPPPAIQPFVKILWSPVIFVKPVFTTNLVYFATISATYAELGPNFVHMQWLNVFLRHHISLHFRNSFMMPFLLPRTCVLSDLLHLSASFCKGIDIVVIYCVTVYILVATVYVPLCAHIYVVATSCHTVN